MEVSLWTMSVLFVLAGVNHFVNPGFYLKIIPPYLPFHRVINSISGLAEILLGILLLFPAWQKIAAYGIVLLLIAIFPANIYHFQNGLKKKKMVFVLALRLPLQGVLIWWAYQFT